LFTDRAIKVVKPGGNILVNGAPHYVKKIMQGKRGKGGGFVKATLKNLLTTSTFEKTFTSDESGNNTA
jgi:translation elongation factor P/translation initiation factor 5A